MKVVIQPRIIQPLKITAQSRCFKHLIGTKHPDLANSIVAFLLNRYQIIDYKFGYKGLVARARKANNIEGFSKISDLGSHPSPLASGRCHDAGQAVFYGAFDIDTALSEVEANRGDIIQLTEFRMNPLRCAVVGDAFSVYRSGHCLLPNVDAKSIASLTDTLPLAEQLRVFHMDASLAALLSDRLAKDNAYLTTRSLTKQIKTQLPGIDGVIFPSVRSPRGVNLALYGSLPSALSIERTLVLKIINRFDHGLYDYDVLKSSMIITHDGTIIW